MSDFNKMPADGWCGACGEKVPESSTNKFYCSYGCRREAWNYHHPEQRDEDDRYDGMEP